jgi:hypothetical protein
MILLVIAASAIAAQPTAGNWGVGKTANQAKKIQSPNTGHLFVTQDYMGRTVVEDATLIHPCSKNPNKKYHEVVLFDYSKNYLSVVSGGAFSYQGTGYLQNAGKPGGLGSKKVTVSFSGTFTSAKRATGSYQVHAHGCGHHSFVAVWYN